MKFLRPARPLSAIGTAPLVGICVCLVLAAAPLFTRVAGWAIAMLFVSVAARLHTNRRPARLPSLPLKVVLFGLSAAGIAATYGSMIGIEPGLTILVVLVSLKIIETNGERDYQVVTLLGYFLCLCTLFFSQDLLLWLYAAAVFVLLTAMLVRFHRGGAGGWRAPMWLSAKMLLQALPIIVLLFLFFPRTATGFRFQFGRSIIGAAGMSDRLAPGSISSLVLNEDIAFRVEFPDGNSPPISQMYWRGGVLWRGDGLTWVAGPQLPLERRAGQLAGPAIRQRISLQPHGGRWIFALDRPSMEGGKFEPNAGGFLSRRQPIFNTLHYEVVSQPENHELALPFDQMRAALAPASRPSPRIAALIADWKRAAPEGGRALVERALHHFREEKFSYSLEPGSYADDGLEDFLFKRRAGFCEHYAAAFATLMRAAGVPARVIIGYHGGELNRHGNYVIVRQSDAHAWAEVWLQGSGWLRVDPTEMIAPDRIQSGLASYLQTRGGGPERSVAESSDAMVGWREFTRDLGLAWDSLNYQWELRVLTFNEDEQQAFLARLGFARGHNVGEWLVVLITIGTVLGLTGIWLQRPGPRRRDVAKGAWADFCRTLAAAGLPREPSEGPARFGARAAAHFPHSRDAILRIAALYTRLRYAPQPPAPGELAAAVRELRGSDLQHTAGK